MAQLSKLLIVLAAVTATLGAPIDPRQMAGEGNACSSVFSSTDNGVGYGTENAEDNVATLLGGSPSRGGGTGGPKVKRQGDKMANGAAAILNTVGQNQAADLVQTDGDNVDGQLTDDATTVGAQFGGDEEDVLERLGNMVPSKLPATPNVPAVPNAPAV